MLNSALQLVLLSVSQIVTAVLETLMLVKLKQCWNSRGVGGLGTYVENICIISVLC
jgi:hypothetical protein